MTTKTGNIKLPIADEAAAHMYPSDLKTFEVGEHTATAFSIAVGCPSETSQPLFTLDQVRAAIELDRQQRGEPVAWVSEAAFRKLVNHKDVVTVSYEPKRERIIPLYAGPQPDEPVKVPSDDDLIALAVGDVGAAEYWEFSRDELVRLMRFTLARYGAQPTASAEPVGTVCWRGSPYPSPSVDWIGRPPEDGASVYAVPVAAQPFYKDNTEFHVKASLPELDAWQRGWNECEEMQRDAQPSVPDGWREQFSNAVYDNLAAADNQDIPLEEYPARILKVLDSIVGPRHPTVIHWRNDAIQACIAIAYRYCRDPESFRYLKQDLQALITAPTPPSDGQASRKFVAGEKVISKPGAAITVKELELTPAGKQAITTGIDGPLPGTQTDEQAQQDADKVDAVTEMVHAMFRSRNDIPVTRITITREQYDAARAQQEGQS
ncbi:MAG: hypothetical protein WBF88_07275 [Pusillimonas sp.]